MISRKVIDQFLNRELDNWDRIKDLSNDELDDWIKRNIPNANLPKSIFQHQKASFILGTQLPRFLFLLDMGTGKTLIAQCLLDYYINSIKLVGSVLVLVPNSVSIANWQDDLKLFKPHLKVVGLYGSTEDRWKLLKKKADVFVLNYQGLVYMATEHGVYIQGRSKKVKSGRIINKDLIGALSEKFDGLVCDEIHNAKHHTSLTYQVCNQLSPHMKICYGLTGTPMGRDPQDLWSQFFLIDRGETLGRTLSMYRECFFTQKINYWGGYEYNFNKKMDNKLHTMIKHRSIRYGAEECIDLPDIVHHVREVELTESAKEHYDRLADTFVNGTDYREKEVSFLRMRQISSGYVGFKTDTDKIEVDLPENPKLEALMDILDGIPDNRKIIIFHDFIKSGDLIEAAIKQAKYKYARLWSGTKDPAKELGRFKTDPDCRIFLSNSRSGGVGLNLQMANYCIFFESPIDPIIRVQAEKRVHRQGQQADKVFIYDLVTKDTCDRRILEFLKQGQNLFDALMKGKASWK